MLYYVYFSEAGLPKIELHPIFLYLYTAGESTGTGSATSITGFVDKSGDAYNDTPITEIGGGWYAFDITYGQHPWDDTTQDLVGVIDGGSELADDVDRYKPVVISLRGLALARIAHKGTQNKQTGDVTIYKTDGNTAELLLDMDDGGTIITRAIKTATP